MVTRIRARLEPEATLDLQAAMPRQVSDVPERVRLAFEQRDDDGAAGRKREHGLLEEGHEQLLVVPDLPVDVRALPAHVGEVEDDPVHDAHSVLAFLV